MITMGTLIFVPKKMENMGKKGRKRKTIPTGKISIGKKKRKAASLDGSLRKQKTGEKENRDTAKACNFGQKNLGMQGGKGGETEGIVYVVQPKKMGCAKSLVVKKK